MSGPTRARGSGSARRLAVKAILLDGDDVTDETFDLAGKTGTIRVVMTDRMASLDRDDPVQQRDSRSQRHRLPGRGSEMGRSRRGSCARASRRRGRFRVEDCLRERYSQLPSTTWKTARNRTGNCSSGSAAGRLPSRWARENSARSSEVTTLKEWGGRHLGSTPGPTPFNKLLTTPARPATSNTL